MKKDIMCLKKINIFVICLACLVFATTLIFGVNFAIKSYASIENISLSVLADEDDEEVSLDKNVHIENDGTIFEPNLWRALKRFYNNAVVDEDDKVDDYFTIELFKNPNFTLTALNLSGKSIEDISNLKYMDLTMFEEIDLSYNQIENIADELSTMPNLKKINLCGNKITEFDCTKLHQSCYSQNLIELNLSNNNISICNLKEILQGEIDISLNNITDSNLTLPENTDVVVYLSHNVIDNPNEDNANLHYGFQGVKPNQKYVIGKKIHFYGYETFDEIGIFSLSVENPEDENPVITETLIKTLEKGHDYEFGIGYYKIKWTNNETDNPYLADIIIYISPKAPSVKMLKNGQELSDVDYKLTEKATIKIYGEEGAKTYYSINGQAYIEGTEFEINNVGINYILITQVIDGYQSEVLTLYITYNPPNTRGWIVLIAGTAIFVLLFYLAIKYYPMLVKFHIGKSKKNNNKNLD